MKLNDAFILLLPSYSKPKKFLVSNKPSGRIQFVAIKKKDHKNLSELVINGFTLPKATIVYTIKGLLFFGVTGKLEHVFAVTHKLISIGITR